MSNYIELKSQKLGEGACQNCGKNYNELNFVSLTLSGKTKSYVICNDCLTKLKNKVDKNNFGISVDRQDNNQINSPQNVNTVDSNQTSQPIKQKKSIKKMVLTLISVALVVAIIVGVVLGLVIRNSSSSFKTDGWIDSNHIYFGSYPQSEVQDSELIAELNAQDGTWLSFGYFSGPVEYMEEDLESWRNGGMVSSDYMRYKDIVYNGEKYRAVTFDSYRPYGTVYKSSETNSYQMENGFITGNVYWFKYEPLKWRVLDLSIGLILCETVIDSQPYNNYMIYGPNKQGEGEYWGDSAKTYYASNYEKSSIREWLNNDFYNTSFIKPQKSIIFKTELNNDSLRGNAGFSEYDSSSTNDNIFLLSWNDIINESYGFSTDYDEYDSARLAVGSDYALCQGLEDKDNTRWWLRTPSSGSQSPCEVEDGFASEGENVYSTDIGIRPALRVDLKSKPFKKNNASKINDNNLSIQPKSEFIIEGKWKNVGNTSCAQMQVGSITTFDGTHCNVYSPSDTYAFYESNGEYHLDCTSFFAGDSMSFKVIIIDNNNIELIYDEYSTVKLQRVS